MTLTFIDHKEAETDGCFTLELPPRNDTQNEIE